MKDYVILAICGAVGLAATAVIIVVVFLKTELRDWMRRVRGIGPRGIELGPPPGQQQQVAAAERAQEPALATTPAIPPLLGLAFWQQEVEIAINRQNLRNSPQLVDQLKHAVALAVRANDFHLTLRLIFGTQMAALTLLNTNANGLTLEDFRHLFIEHQVRTHLEGTTYTPDILAWLNFRAHAKTRHIRECPLSPDPSRPRFYGVRRTFRGQRVQALLVHVERTASERLRNRVPQESPSKLETFAPRSHPTCGGLGSALAPNR